ncbi:MAG: response regulator [Bacteroidetes bacterium]|nr:response regulator [Bacteroidota bacterium]MCB0842356.1 response regulator [Bacteroidota bacterium]MCB0853543.1 response regulator [Bacteroidota bacterium]
MNKFKHLVFIDDDYPTNYYHQIIAEHAEIAEEMSFFQLGEKALEQLIQWKERSEDPPEIIFLDINMPGMTGWEFLDLYRDEIGQTSTRIIILTTSVNPEDAKKANDHDLVNGFISKPLTVEIFNGLREELL